MMKEKTTCFTGHRNIPVSEYPQIQKRLADEILNLIHQGVDCFYAGGARGFDTMAALAVLNLKKEFPHIRLILALPCKNQTKGWCEENKKTYSLILENADEAVYTSENYHRVCMQIPKQPLTMCNHLQN